MSRQLRRIGRKGWVAGGFLIWLVALATVAASPPGWVAPATTPQYSAPAQNTSQVPAKPPAKSAPTGLASYVGEATCLTCHDDRKKGYEGSPHAMATDARTPAAQQGCESCHGAGSLHVADPVSVKPRQFSKAAPAEVNAACTTCHNKGEHALWDGSQHEARGLSCASCHSVHSPKAEFGHLKEKTQLDVCAKCHRDKIAKLDRSGHMPVREGKLTCMTCHNVHGSTNVRLLRKGDSVAELCTSCHADKRGPFLWEHAPARDGCATCHDPHGSSNERMLVAKPPILCQRCHVGTRHPATIYDAAAMGAGASIGGSPSIRVYARSCVACHSAIHGSNHPSGQRFIR
jgi:DmsE family decaheme c-type cytochrome